jgi:hypothetical protein
MPLRFFYAPVCGGLLIPHVSLSPDYCSATAMGGESFWDCFHFHLSGDMVVRVCFLRLIAVITTSLFPVLGSHDYQVDINLGKCLHKSQSCTCRSTSFLLRLRAAALMRIACLHTNAHPLRTKSRFCFPWFVSVSSNSRPVDISDIAVGVFFKKKQMFSPTVIWKRKNVANSSVNPAVKGWQVNSFCIYIYIYIGKRCYAA